MSQAISESWWKIANRTVNVENVEAPASSSPSHIDNLCSSSIRAMGVQLLQLENQHNCSKMKMTRIGSFLPPNLSSVPSLAEIFWILWRAKNHTLALLAITHAIIIARRWAQPYPKAGEVLFPSMPREIWARTRFNAFYSLLLDYPRFLEAPLLSAILVGSGISQCGLDLTD